MRETETTKSKEIEMGNAVVIKPKTAVTVPGKNTLPAGKKEVPAAKKERKKKEKIPVKFTVDDNNIPNIADAEGALIVGIAPKQFFAYLTEAQKKDKNIRHSARLRALEYAVHMANYRLQELTEKKNPKARLLAKYAKMMEKVKAMKAELGSEVEDVEA